jgi:hypothetical protein
VVTRKNASKAAARSLVVEALSERTVAEKSQKAPERSRSVLDNCSVVLKQEYPFETVENTAFTKVE